MLIKPGFERKVLNLYDHREARHQSGQHKYGPRIHAVDDGRLRPTAPADWNVKENIEHRNYATDRQAPRDGQEGVRDRRIVFIPITREAPGADPAAAALFDALARTAADLRRDVPAT